MPHTSKVLVANKSTSKLVAPDSLNSQIVDICRKSVGKTLGTRGWNVRKPQIETTGEVGNYRHTATVTFHRSTTRTANFKETTDIQWTDITRKFISACRAPGWAINLDGSIDSLPTTVSDTPPDPEVPIFAGADAIIIPDNWRDSFTQVFDRDDQINEIMASIRTAKETNLEVRNHILMYGPAGCGKSCIGIQLEKLFGENAVIKMDATNTTKAGAENLLLEREPIPPILFIEELEKCNEANVPWLLGIMDDRGEIIKTNARIGSVRRRAPMLVICTVNNVTKFETFQEGALNDRFNVPLYFPTPDRDLLKRILIQEVQKIPNGKVEWVEPALDFALNIEKTYQARRIKAIMTNARDTLLDGTYQEARIRMIKRFTEDQKVLKEFNVQV